jgi:hypothetical protein
MNRLFRETYSEGGRDESLTASSFAPAVDVTKTSTRLL